LKIRVYAACGINTYPDPTPVRVRERDAGTPQRDRKRVRSVRPVRHQDFRRRDAGQSWPAALQRGHAGPRLARGEIDPGEGDRFALSEGDGKVISPVRRQDGGFDRRARRQKTKRAIAPVFARLFRYGNLVSGRQKTRGRCVERRSRDAAHRDVRRVLLATSRPLNAEGAGDDCRSGPSTS
jgi:hypothetical protein